MSGMLNMAPNFVLSRSFPQRTSPVRLRGASIRVASPGEAACLGALGRAGAKAAIVSILQ